MRLKAKAISDERAEIPQVKKGAPEKSAALEFKPEAELLEVPDSPEIQEIHVARHLSNLPDNQFLIYSPTAVDKLGFEESAFGSRAKSDRDTSIAFSELQKVQIPYNCEEITVFGAGRAIDIAKYLAYLHGKKLNIIPSLLSTNTLGTPFGCYENLNEDRTKTTLHTGYANKILVDFDYLNTLESRNIYGLADVLSIATALHDWDLAISQDPSLKNEPIYQKAKKIADSCFRQIGADTLDNRTVFNLIVNAAYITGLYGNGRPESGSEHIFSKFMELEALRKKDPIMHGVSVGLGIALMATLQNNKDRQRLFAAIRRLGLLSEYEGREKELEALAAHILMQLEPHPMRYSIVNARLNDLRNPSFSADLAHTVVGELFPRKGHE